VALTSHCEVPHRHNPRFIADTVLNMDSQALSKRLEQIRQLLEQHSVDELIRRQLEELAR